MTWRAKWNNYPTKGILFYDMLSYYIFKILNILILKPTFPKF